jgi:Carboxypeptidase regulatory-like domain
MVKRVLLFCISALLLVSLDVTAGPLPRQGEIKGRVTDPQGSGVLGTTVVFRNTVTGKEYRATTDQNGEYLISGIEPGKYELETQTGQTTTANQINIEVGGTYTVTIVQDTAGQLEVRAETQVQDTTTATIKSVFDDLQIELLPQPNAITRNGQFFGPYNLSLLSEGVTTGYIFQNGVGPSVGGRPNTSNNFHVNGTDNNNQATPGPLVTVTNEATTDFTLMQGQQSPQFGHSTGGQMNTFLADGTNKWHGGVYEYWNNRKLNGVEPVLRGQPALRYDQNRLGGKVGGPLMAKKVFVFGDFEYIPLGVRQPLLNPAFAPTAAGFTTLATVPGVSTTNLAVLQNNLQVSQTPVATTTVSGVTVPLGLVNTGVRRYQNQYNGIVNIDWNVNAKSSLGVRYIHDDVGTNAFGSNLPAFRVPGHARSLLGTISYTATPSSFLTYNLNAGYNRLDEKIGGGNFVFPGLSSFPNFTIQGLGLPLGTTVPFGRARTNMYHESGSADWRLGSNDIRFGVDVRKLQSVFGNFASAAGAFTFSSLERFLLDLPPDVGGLQTFGGTSFIGNRMLLHPYIQDSFRIKRVDIELGLAYEHSSVPESLRRQRRLSSLSVPGLISFGEPRPDRWNFEPRVGAAWSPGTTGRTVLRGGFGIVYDTLFANSSLLAPDMTVRTVSSTSLNTPGFFATGGVTHPTTTAGAVGILAAPRQELPYIYYWNGAVSHGFWGRLATEVKYMGHHGVNLPLQSFFNDSRVSAVSSLPVFFTNPGIATLDALSLTQAGLATATTPFTTAGFTNSILTVTPEGNSWYNAAAVKISETFTAGTQIMAQYTYQDVRSNATGTPLDLAFGKRMEQVPWNQKHRTTITPIIDVASMLPSSNSLIREVVANLSIMGTYTYAKGSRIPLFSAIDTSMNASSLGSGVFVNPNGIGGLGSGVSPLTNSSGQVVAFVATNPNAQIVSGAPGTFSAARPTMRLADTQNVDLSIVKRFSIPDRAKVEVRGDAYNLANHPQFTGMPVSTLGAPLTTTPSFLVPNDILFSNLRATLSGNPRTLQFAVRVLF